MPSIANPKQAVTTLVCNSCSSVVLGRNDQEDKQDLPVLCDPRQWATTREKKTIKDSGVVLLILQTMLPPPVDMEGDTRTTAVEYPGGKL